MRKLLMCICVLMLFGCGEIGDKGIREAYKVCESHGGLNTISPIRKVSDDCVVTCKDGFSVSIYFGK